MGVGGWLLARCLPGEDTGLTGSVEENRMRLTTPLRWGMTQRHHGDENPLPIRTSIQLRLYHTGTCGQP